MRKGFAKFYWSLPNFCFIFITQIRLRVAAKIKIQISSKNGKLVLSEKGISSGVTTIWVAERKRLFKFKNGIQPRIEQIGSEYCVESVPLYAGGWVIDIGANIGEFSMFVHNKMRSARIICIEPSEKEAECCDLNLIDSEHWTIQKCLWENEGIMDFYHANETGDSSLLPTSFTLPSSKINVSTLDAIITSFPIDRVMLMKLEAEGAEPEILKGGLSTLAMTEYVTADLGPERGTEQLRTFSECHEILISNNFKLIQKYQGKREVYLFKNLALMQN
jgi:FkbM family methyltransferase